MKRILSLVTLLLSCMLVATAAHSAVWSPARFAGKGFSANLDMTSTDKSGEVDSHITGSMCGMKKHMRMDMDMAGAMAGKKHHGDEMPMGMGRMYTLTDMEKHTVCMVFPENKFYTETNMDEMKKHRGQNHNQDWMNHDMEYEVVGEEKIDGHPCRKVNGKWKNDDEESKGTFWLANDLDDMMLKAEIPGRKGKEMITVLYKDVKVGPVPDSKFAIPADFKKGSMMDMIKASMKGMGGMPGMGKHDAKEEKEDSDKEKEKDK